MNNTFNIQNYFLWVRMAIYANKPNGLHYTGKDKSYFGRRKRRLDDMKADGYLVRTQSMWNDKSRHYKPTDKFVKEFIEKYKELSRIVLHEVTEEKLDILFKTYNFNKLAND